MKSYGRITTKRRAVAGYTAIPASSGGGSSTTPINWHASTTAFVQTQLAVAAPMSVMWWAEFAGNPAAPEFELGAASGAGTAVLTTTISGGALTLSSGASANGGQAVRQKNGNGSPPNAFTANMKTGVWALANRAKILNTNATSDLILAGLSDETVLTVYFGVHGATSLTNLCFVSTAGHDLGVAFTANVYQDYLIIANGTTVQCYLGDGTGTAYVAAGAAQDQTVFPTNPTHWYSNALNNATAALAQFQIDKAIALSASPS